jgi:hypothetical protein
VRTSPRTTVVGTALRLACAALTLGLMPDAVHGRDPEHARWRVRVVPGSPPGPYTLADWKRDWPGCTFEDGVSEARVSIVRAANLDWWRVTYAAGGSGPDRGGSGWRWQFVRRPHRACELSYELLFDEGFEFVKGGKLPGLCGGPETITGGKTCTGHDGWSARLMWRKDGRGQAYVYHAAKQKDYGDEFDFPDDVHFPIGVPLTVRIAVGMNEPGRCDGTLRVWMTDAANHSQLVVDRSDLQYTNTDTIGVDSVLFNTFHGGHDASWAPRHACSACFTEFRVTGEGDAPADVRTR